MDIKLPSLILGLLLIPSISYANHSCEAEVTAVDINSRAIIHASVKMDLRSGSTKRIEGLEFCNIDQKNGFSTEACKAIYAMLLSSHATGHKIKMWFNDDTNTSCDKGNWADMPKIGFYHLRVMK